MKGWLRLNTSGNTGRQAIVGYANFRLNDKIGLSRVKSARHTT